MPGATGQARPLTMVGPPPQVIHPHMMNQRTPTAGPVVRQVVVSSGVQNQAPGVVPGQVSVGPGQGKVVQLQVPETGATVGVTAVTPTTTTASTPIKVS